MTLGQLERNWFSLESVRRSYDLYKIMDVDGNGLLSKTELAGYNNGSLTSAFIDRIFEDCNTVEGEMDFKDYLDLVLAFNNRIEDQSIAFIFRKLDLGGRGRLCNRTLEYFIESLLQKVDDGPDTPVAGDIIDEIYDMVRPKSPIYITLDDLLKSGRGGIVMGMLTDARRFALHEDGED